jgi:hypothetical protein
MIAAEELRQHVLLGGSRPRGIQGVPPPRQVRRDRERLSLRLQLDDRDRPTIHRAQLECLLNRLDPEREEIRSAERGDPGMLELVVVHAKACITAATTDRGCEVPTDKARRHLRRGRRQPFADSRGDAIRLHLAVARRRVQQARRAGTHEMITPLAPPTAPILDVAT